MSVSSDIRAVFGHFQNLNLLVLLADLGSDHTARRAWSQGTLLCPIARGLPAGEQVQRLNILGQLTNLGHGCDYAARCLGADAAAVLRFVRAWDEQSVSRDWLLQQLDELWQERLADAEVMQAVLHANELVEQPGTVFFPDAN
jgi:hypothetical protein